MGASRNPALGAEGLSHRRGPRLRCHLPEARKGCGDRHAQCGTAAMTAHLAEISDAVSADVYSMVLLDRAGWLTTMALEVPKTSP